MRTGDYQNAEYDRKLAEYKALKAQMKQEKQGMSQTQAKPVQQTQQKPAQQQSQNSNSVVKRY
jgi:hypothetical protein